MINNVKNVTFNFFKVFTLTRHKSFADNLTKQNQSSGENEEVAGLIIRKDQLLIVHRVFELYF